MLRLIGILIGSALAIGLLIVTLGIPQFSDPEPVAATLAVSEPISVHESSPETGPAATPKRAPEPEPAPEPVPTTKPVSAPVPDTDALIEEIFAPATSPEASPAADENWYAFWSPFRSELAANGFVAQLQETTGIDYRVVKIKTGVYEVAFTYTDDADVQDKLARISAATGLDMSGS